MIFLGTGASELVPNPFCDCETCEKIRQSDDLPRKRSALYIDEHSVVDFGPDVLSAAQMYDVKFSRLKNIFITHTHNDHFSIDNIGVLSVTKQIPIAKTIFMSEEAAEWFERVLTETRSLIPPIDTIASLIDKGKLSIQAVKPYTEFFVDDMKVSAVQSNHYARYPYERALNYCFKMSDGTKILYVLDSGFWDEKNLKYYENLKADVLIMEGTFGDTVLKDFMGGHLNAENFLLQCDNFKKHAIITDRTKIYVTHISQVNSFGQREYQDYVAQNSSLNITIAYDGMVI